MRIFVGRCGLNLTACAVAACLAGAHPASAHEFWLDPVSFTPKAGAAVPVLLRNGMNFLGDSYPYQRKWATRFIVRSGKVDVRIRAVEGDDPAAEVKVATPGLAIVAFERAPDVADYKTLAHFLEVLDDEGLTALAARYRATPNAPQALREVYTRHAKTLLAVGTTRGIDQAIGMPVELVVETNPYELAPGAPLVVRLLKDGQPVDDVQIKAFNRPPGNTAALQPIRVRTDRDGRATIAGLVAGEVLLSAAVFKPGTPRAADEGLQVQWESKWASVTFRR